MQAQSCPRLLNEVIEIKRSLSMHIRFVERAHAVRQTDSVFFCRLCCSNYGLNGRCICKLTLPFILPLSWQILAQTASVFDSISCCAIEKVLLDVCNECFIHFSKVFSFGSDGASVMTGVHTGVATRLKQLNPQSTVVLIN